MYYFFFWNWKNGKKHSCERKNNSKKNSAIHFLSKLKYDAYNMMTLNWYHKKNDFVFDFAFTRAHAKVEL